MNYFITAIGTDCGKTIVSAIFCQKLKADYWKPIQTGSVSDSLTVKSLVSHPVIIHPETYLLKEPLSPHIAAKMENKRISVDTFKKPDSQKDLIIEGAGGILVPLNEQGDFFIDYVSDQDWDIVVVVKLYLGCINHTLLTLNELKRRHLNIKGLVFNGNDDFDAIHIITSLSGLQNLLHIAEEESINRGTILKYVQQLYLNEY